MIKNLINKLTKQKSLKQLGWKYWGKVDGRSIYIGYNSVLFLKFIKYHWFPCYVTLFDHNKDDYRVTDFKVYNYKELVYILKKCISNGD